MARRAIIAGAGIAGLGCALALAKAGFDCAIFERAPALAEYGAGVQLPPNATRALDAIGVLEAVRARASEPQAINLIRGRDGARLARLPIGGAEPRWGAPWLAIERAALQGALAEAAAGTPGIALSFGAEVAGVGAADGGVVAGVKRGLLTTREAGDLLVGADGLRSLARERLGLGERGAARFSGRVAFRALIDAGDVDAAWREPAVALHLGPRAHLVAYPVREASFVNVVAVVQSEPGEPPGGEPWDGEADAAMLRRAFARWSAPTRALIAAGDWRAFPLYDRPALDSLAHGGVALVGDAAHPMLPFLAQGAAQAIEDAAALGAALTGARDIAAALALWSATRAPRAARVQRQSLAQARLYHLGGPLALARDLALRALGPERLLARYDWLYRG